MAFGGRGEKKTASNGWRVSGVDSMGRPVYTKDPHSAKGRAHAKRTIDSALDPMSDVAQKSNEKLLRSLPEEFNDVFYSDGWQGISEDGNTLHGYADVNGQKVLVGMSRRSENETIISVGDEVVASLSNADVNELGMRKLEGDFEWDERLNRKYVNSGVAGVSPDGVKYVSFEAKTGEAIVFEDNGDGSVSCHATYGEETVEIASNIDPDDIPALTNEFSKQMDKEQEGGLMTRAATTMIMGNHLKKEWRRWNKRRNKVESPDVPIPFASQFFNFIGKGFLPFDRMGTARS